MADFAAVFFYIYFFLREKERKKIFCNVASRGPTHPAHLMLSHPDKCQIIYFMRPHDWCVCVCRRPVHYYQMIILRILRGSARSGGYLSGFDEIINSFWSETAAGEKFMNDKEKNRIDDDCRTPFPINIAVFFRIHMIHDGLALFFVAHQHTYTQSENFVWRQKRWTRVCQSTRWID